MKKRDFLRELRSLNLSELKRRKEDIRTRVISLRFKLREGLLKNPLQLRTLSRDIAIVNTILKEKGS